MATGTTFDVGEMRVRILDDGVFITDAGNLFGGSRKMRIRGAMHAVLVETGDDLVLIDAGFGPELPEALVGRYELRREKSLMDHLQEAGYSAEDVTRVILSHLDADHVGWALEPRASPTPPSTCRRTRSRRLGRCRRATDAEKRFLPSRRGVEEGWSSSRAERRGRAGDQGRGQVRALRGTPDRLDRRRRRALHRGPGAGKIWLDPDLISGVDTDPEAARRNRIEVLEEAEAKGATVILYHEPGDFLVKIQRTEKGFKAVPVEN